MSECWKSFNKGWPSYRLMKCRYCHNLEWRGDMSIEKMRQVGCYKCRLLLNDSIHEDDDLTLKIKKKTYHYIIRGRYE